MSTWDYETLSRYDGLNVEITDKNGIKHSGCVIVVNTAEDLDTYQDELTLETDEGRFIGFGQSNIDTISILVERGSEN